jgi:methylated-DNA-[protein]-cysteine S-methyltransferase
VQTSVRKVVYPDGEPEKLNPLLKETIRQLKEYFDGKLRAFSIPTRQEGTPFQQKVWEALTTIPYGERISYSELAGMIGHPQSFRAVGNANGANHICIIVPCHRVIQLNGQLGGYAYGLEMKRFLLDLEKNVEAIQSPA